MLLLSAVDGMSGAVSAATNGAWTHFLARLAGIGGPLTMLSKSPFLGCLLARALRRGVGDPLARAARPRRRDLRRRPHAPARVRDICVACPARRATRAVELLFALILSKFAIVAALSLGGAALNAGGLFGAGKISLGLVIVGLAATAPAGADAPAADG